MCGRFVLTLTWSDLVALYHIGGRSAPRDLPPRFNIAPTQTISAIRRDGRTGERELVALRWGLVPSWARDPAIGTRMVNARAETVAEKPAFRGAFARRRCLIPASGFYEWRKRRCGGRKQPFMVAARDGAPFAFAGLWERWDPGSGGEALETCTILTTQANDLMRPIHDRMPVILRAEDHEAWLDTGRHPPETVHGLLRPASGDGMSAVPVGTYVNAVTHDGPRCLEPADADAADLFDA